jgi:hypothetical protein
MLKPIAISGMTLTISPSTVTGVISITSPPSTRVNAGSAGVYRGPVIINVTGVTQGDFIAASPVPGTLQPTATKGRAESQFLLREGDKASGLSTTGTHSSSGTTTPINFEVEVTSAGQTKDRSE